MISLDVAASVPCGNGIAGKRCSAMAVWGWAAVCFSPKSEDSRTS